ncbi:MAG: bifunctional glycosyltransferase family 2 protein/CDP-glycerol:glycerophosphate glycerophosphotransferase [Bacilli bacterium]|jgi:CDP-glycerol glycerophosphotransferase|nr:bifunctional glycosyltransferase family 2 protein/CDP-glycerol:glycerophosphate glycerophosphotransferase [Bacilli bacterium]
MKKYKVSCIIPIYNVEYYIEECIDSVVNQTIFEDVEVILINDGTPDNSIELCQPYLDKYDNIQLFNYENGGLSKARNRGVTHAHGEYIAFLDSDDILAENAYELMYNNAKEYDCDLVCGYVLRFNDDKTYTSKIHKIAFDGNYYGVTYKDIPHVEYDTTSWNKLFRRSFYLENNFAFPEGILYEDIAVSSKAHVLAKKMSFMSDDVVYYWRSRPGSITRNRLDEDNFPQRVVAIKVALDFLEASNHKYDDYLEKFLTKTFDFDLIIFVNLFSVGDKVFRNNIVNYLHDIIGKHKEVIRNDLKTVNKIKYRLIYDNKQTELINYLNHITKINKIRKRNKRILRSLKSPKRLKKYAIKLIKRISYRFFQLLPINNKKIFFESDWGGSYKCNPRAIYEYIIDNNLDYICAWSFKDKHTPIKGHAKKVRRYSIGYYYNLATAKYFINNVNWPNGAKKRDGQFEIETFHGTFLKKMGFDVASEVDTPNKYNGLKKRVSRYDCGIAQGKYMSTKIKEAFLLPNLEILETGYPRNDVLFQEHDINKLKEKYNLPLDKKLILYAPTFRNKVSFNIKMDLDRLRKEVGNEYIILFRLHYMIKDNVDFEEYYPFIQDVSDIKNLEELMLISDALITDYSSIMFDYSILNKPMLFYIYDLPYYSSIRGIYFDIEKECPGPIIKKEEEVYIAIKDLFKNSVNYNDKYQEFKNKFVTFEEGNACQKVIERLQQEK